MTTLRDTILARVRPVQAALTARFAAAPKPARVALSVGLTVVVVLGATAGGVGAVSAANAATRSNAFTSNTAAASLLAAARQQNTTVTLKLNAALLAGAALNIKVTGFVAGATGVVDPAALAGLDGARAKLATAVTGIAKDRSVDLTTGIAGAKKVTKAPTVTGETETRDVLSATRTLDALTSAAKRTTKGTSYLITTIAADTTAVTKSVTPVVKSVAAAGKARLDATASAGAPERDAVTAAIAAVKNDGTALDTLIVYTAATTAVQTSNDNAIAAAAAAAAAQAAAAQAAADAAAHSSGGSYAGNSGSGKSSGGSYAKGTAKSSGGSTSGGGTSKSSGGSSSGGSSSGGAAPAPAPAASNWRPMQTHYDSGPCTGAGGGQSVTYGSTLNIPVGAFNVSFNEVSGYGWHADWACDTGW